jgi:carbonic anhydrase/acetyltransferase-like protein (isoleucine patch superfamily)
MPIYELDGVRPKLPASGRFWVAPDAALIGNVELEEEASVWFQAVLRGDNERILIGKRSNVQDGAIFHTDPGFPLTVGAGCTIGHHAILHGCTIGDGADCIVGAGALVTEGKEFPPRSLIVGAPARAIRTLDEAGVQMAHFGAQAYFMRWQQYAKGLKQVG